MDKQIRISILGVVICFVLVLGSCSSKSSEKVLEYLFPQDLQTGQYSGLYIENPQELGLTYSKAMVPLKHINYYVQIVNSLAHITLRQQYENPSSKYLNVYYSFPINPDSSLYRLVAQFGNITVEGVVRQREEAEREFQKAKKQGVKAVLTSFEQKSKDIIHMKIGNIPPKTRATITLQYLQQLSLSVSKFYNILVPSTISPRYIDSMEQKQQLRKLHNEQNQGIKYQNRQYPVQEKFDWSFIIELKTNNPITFYKSPTHELLQLSSNANKSQIVLSLQSSSVPNKDFNFIYTTEDFQLPTYVMGKNQNTTTVMVSFVPKFSHLSNQQSYQNLRQNKLPQFDFRSVRGEYVFILDRSGSMQEQRIEKAVKALVIFLKSLPQNSYFNVVSFGSEYEFMYPESQKYSNEKIKEAVQKVMKMGADMGGTQIYKMLENVLKQKEVEGYPKLIFMLTDGDVYNTEKVVRMAKRNSKNSRIYTIGVGNGASMSLIKGCAQAGRGKYVKINDQESPAQKIWNLLQSALTPLITKIDLQYDKDIFTSVIPNPNKMPFILKDDIVTFYLMYNGDLKQKTTISLEYQDPITGKKYKVDLQVDPNSKNFLFVDKMAHFKVLRVLQNLSHEQNRPTQQYLIYEKLSKQNSYKKQAELYSIKHQILSEYTSFLGLSKQLTGRQSSEYKQIGYQSLKVQQMSPFEYQDDDQNNIPGSGGFGGFGGLNMRSVKYSMRKSVQYNFKSADILIIDIDDGVLAMNSKGNQTYQEDHQESDQDQDQEQGQQQQQEQEQEQEEIQQQQRVEQIEQETTIHQKSVNKQQIIEQIIINQNTDGSWSNQMIVDKIYAHCKCFNLQKVKQLSKQIDKDIVYTKFVLEWLRSLSLGKQYTFILKKAEIWLDLRVKQREILEEKIKLVLLQS